MTYLEFYQTWLELVRENIIYHDESETEYIYYGSWVPNLISIFFKFSGFIYLTYLAVIIVSDYEIKIKIGLTIFMLVYSRIIYELYTYKKKFSVSEVGYVRSKYPIPWIEFPEYDYTVAEFQENMTRIGQKASPEQIELAKTVLKDCFENLLPSDYQVNHSSIVRRYINSPAVKDKFSVKDVEIYRNISINELIKSN